MMNLKKNDILISKIDGYTSQAQGVCHVEGQAVFAPQALTDEECEIKILKVSASECYGRIEKILQPSPARVKPECPLFGKCGGCDTMHMCYEEELRFKLQKVNDALQRIGAQSLRAEEIIGSEEQLYYRNKGIFAVANIQGRAAYGFFRERSHQLVEVEQCLIQNELSNKVAATVTAFMNKNGIKAYDESSGKGCVRHIFCRSASRGGDAVACIVAARGFGGFTQELVDTLRASCPQLSGIVLNINKIRGNSILGGEFHTLWGRASIRDTLCGLRFEIAPQAFFQINPPQAEKLYERACEYAGGGKRELAIDVYCGTGTISLCLSRQFNHVIGAEIVDEAVENARKNAAENGIDNVEFLCADAAEAAETLARRKLRPDVILVDPPRKGMDSKTIAACASMEPERVVYVSCNPSTLARDILRFNEYGYTLSKITAVDMFPRTSHVETVVLLSRKTPNAMI